MNILAIDPGNTSGIAVWEDTPHQRGNIMTHEVPGGFDELVKWVMWYEDTFGLLRHPGVRRSQFAPDLVVVERWVTTGQKITYQPAAQQGWGYMLGKGIEWGLPVYDPRAVDHKPRSGVKKPRRQPGNHILTLGWAPKTTDRHQEDAASLVLDALFHYDNPTYEQYMGPVYQHVTI